MSTLALKPGQPRAIAFAPEGVRTDLRLLEVDETLLQEIIQKGVVIKGGEEDEAVLVTSCRTYAMKLVETTNLQLLVGPQQHENETEQGLDKTEDAAAAEVVAGEVPGYGSGLMTQWNHFRSASCQDPVKVNATSTSHIELVEVAPRLEALRGLLWQRPYGMEDERVEAEGRDTEMGEAAGRTAAGYTFEGLLAMVQASPEELRAALVSEGALELGGCWRAVDPNYLGSLLELVLLTAEQDGMTPSALRASRLVASLQSEGYRPALVRHCLSVYGKPVETDSLADVTGIAGQDAWCLDETKVCIHFAHKVMGGRAMLLSDFNAAWRHAVPYGMTPSLDMLRSEALIDGSGPEARISSFPASALPRDPGERFAALFGRRARWEWTALEPFLEGIQVPGQSAEALLMRFARASQLTPDAPLVYSAR
ncbi:hypothetical protein Vafri_18331 [Volvox africanus]|uniref:Sister chromatid cohesion protein DCC1 n=1 Tax=Volvox africanus TaxID=51714 RepID=A0A8J4FB19_9CHLO|nr:hypothetical protein Vafri_18331 [Volvox africanus]